MEFIIADYVAIGAVLLFALIGLIAGFGKGLKFFTSGIFGVIISVVVCFILFNIVGSLEIVQNLLQRLTDFLATQGTWGEILNKIYIDKIVLALVLFIVCQIVRAIIVAILKSIIEINNIVFKFFNKVLGMLLFLVILAFLVLLVFFVVNWIGETTAENFAALLEGSVFKLDLLFENNPLNDFFRQAVDTVS